MLVYWPATETIQPTKTVLELAVTPAALVRSLVEAAPAVPASQVVKRMTNVSMVIGYVAATAMGMIQMTETMLELPPWEGQLVVPALVASLAALVLSRVAAAPVVPASQAVKQMTDVSMVIGCVAATALMKSQAMIAVVLPVQTDVFKDVMSSVSASTGCCGAIVIAAMAVRRNCHHVPNFAPRGA